MTPNASFAQEQFSYIMPRPPRRKRTVASWIIVITFGGLLLSILTQPWAQAADSGAGNLQIGSLFFVTQVLVSAIVILASIAQLSGFSIRDLLNVRSTQASAEAFPFYVIRSFDELVSYLFPDPTEPVLPDRLVPFFPRIADELNTAFKQRGRLLIRGRSKTGKTREAVELLSRWWYTGPTVLVARNHVNLRPPFAIPDNLPVRNLVLFFDDVDRYCGDVEAIQRLDQTISFFVDLCHAPEELKVIATARHEPEYWQRLQYAESTPPWSEMELVTLPPLSAKDALQLVTTLGQQHSIKMDESTAQELAIKNDGTFLNLVLIFRNWLAVGVTQVNLEDIATFQGDLKRTWRNRYEHLAKTIPAIRSIYASVDLLQQRDVPLHTTLIVDLATEMELGHTYHILAGLAHVIWQKIDLSPGFNWYRDRRHRRRRLILSSFLGAGVLYAIVYLFLRFAPVKVQYELFDGLATQLWLQLLLISPLVLLVSPLIVSYSLRRWRRHAQERVQGVLKRLLVSEIPLRGDQLRPYENQFKGNGESRVWPAHYFVGLGETRTFTRIVAPRLSSLFLQQANILRVNGQLGPGQTLAKIADRLDNRHPAPCFVLGQIGYDGGHYGRALAEFSRSKERNHTLYAALTEERIAWCLYHLGEHNRAELTANQALEKMPTLTSALWVRGLARLMQGSHEAGLSDCRQAALTQTETPQEVIEAIKASSNASANTIREVEGLLAARSSTPKRHTARKYRARAASVVGVITLIVGIFWGIPYLDKYVESDSNFRLDFASFLLNLFPQAPALLDQRCSANTDLEIYAQAIADCSEVIRLDPNNAAAYHNRGYAYRYLREYEKAIADFNEAIRLDPNSVATYNGRGGTYNALREYEKAIADFNEAIRLDPNSVATHNGRGGTYNALREYEKAIADYNEAIRLDPNYARAYNNRGYAYNELREYEKAIADFNEAIRLDPDYTPAYNNRGYTYKSLHEYEKAIADLEKAAELYEAQGQLEDVIRVRGMLDSLK